MHGTLAERKVVTILFIDIVESLATMRDFDPEEAHDLLSSVLARMSDAVHKFGGVVTRTFGDGMMVIFGAPVAQEDHALRACHTSLHLLREMSASPSPHAPIEIRIGLHSGEVAVGNLTTDFSVDYEATGVAVAIASRMQAEAPLGRAAMTVSTRALVRDSISATSLGLRRVKGLEEPIEVFVLDGLTVDRRDRSADVSNALVGRTSALNLLENFALTIAKGSGGVLAVVGEAGIGKTSILDRFLTKPNLNARVVRGNTERFNGMAALFPFREILSDLLDLIGLAENERRDQILRRVGKNKRQHLTSVAPLLALLEARGTHGAWDTLDPLARRNLISAAVIRQLLDESRKQPLLIVVEDLQRTDPSTIELIGILADAIVGHRIGVVVTFRPEFEHPWASKRNYNELRLDRLNDADTRTLIKQLLGDGLAPQLQLQLLSWSSGNPLFLHECVRALVDAKVVGGEPGARVMMAENAAIELPASIAGTISERVDRLPSDAKQVLLAASVLGERFSAQMLAVVTASVESAVRGHLATLEAAEFILPPKTGRDDGDDFAFGHPLFHEVCYATLLRRRRQELHSVVFDALLASTSSNTPPPVERLAHHAFNGHRWNEAFAHCRTAGQRAAASFSNHEAAGHFRRAIESLGKVDATSRRLRDAIEVRFELREAFLMLSKLKSVGRLLTETYAFAQKLRDPKILAKVVGFTAGQAYLTEDPTKCILLCTRALRLARSAKDRTLEVAPNIFQGQAQYALGRYRQSSAIFFHNIKLIDRIASVGPLGLLGRPLVVSRYWLAISMAELGKFGEAEAVARAMLSEESDVLPFDQVYAKLSLGFVLMTRGRFDDALIVTSQAFEEAKRYDIRFVGPVVASQAGFLLARQGRIQEGLELAVKGVRDAEKIGLYAGRSRWIARLGEVYLIAGKLQEAKQYADQAVDIADKAKELGYLSTALRLRGRITSHTEPDCVSARTDLKRSIEICRRLAIGPSLAKSLVELARVERLSGRPDKGRHHIVQAAVAFKRYGMHEWKERADKELEFCRYDRGKGRD